MRMNELHVLPRGDLVEHAADESCACGPRVEVVGRPDGSNGWLYVHPSLDDREADEQ